MSELEIGNKVYYIIKLTDNVYLKSIDLHYTNIFVNTYDYNEAHKFYEISYWVVEAIKATYPEAKYLKITVSFEVEVENFKK
jgi:hypothetical protein